MESSINKTSSSVSLLKEVCPMDLYNLETGLFLLDSMSLRLLTLHCTGRRA